MRVAVTGVNGFVGIHLTRELVSSGHQVIGVGIGPLEEENVGLLDDYFDQDLTLSWPDSVMGDAVVHLAGLSAVGPSFEEPQRYLQTNSALVTHLCETMLAQGRNPRIIVVSSGAVYAPGVGLTEDSPVVASSPYAVSKLLVEMQSAYYRRRGLDIAVMRPFNHIGPGQQPGFLLPDLIASVQAGGPISAGNLETKRDYTDVRDVVRAYRLAAEADRLDSMILNVCSGRSVSGRTVLELVAAAVGVSVPEVVLDHRRLRPDDPEEISGDNALAASALGWRPEFELARTIADTVAAATDGIGRDAV